MDDNASGGVATLSGVSLRELVDTVSDDFCKDAQVAAELPSLLAPVCDLPELISLYDLARNDSRTESVILQRITELLPATLSSMADLGELWRLAQQVKSGSTARKLIASRMWEVALPTLSEVADFSVLMSQQKYFEVGDSFHERPIKEKANALLSDVSDIDQLVLWWRSYNSSNIWVGAMLIKRVSGLVATIRDADTILRFWKKHSDSWFAELLAVRLNDLAVTIESRSFLLTCLEIFLDAERISRALRQKLLASAKIAVVC